MFLIFHSLSWFILEGYCFNLPHQRFLLTISIIFFFNLYSSLVPVVAPENIYREKNQAFFI